MNSLKCCFKIFKSKQAKQQLYLFFSFSKGRDWYLKTTCIEVSGLIILLIIFSMHISSQGYTHYKHPLPSTCPLGPSQALLLWKLSSTDNISHSDASEYFVVPLWCFFLFRMWERLSLLLWRWWKLHKNRWKETPKRPWNCK